MLRLYSTLSALALTITAALAPAAQSSNDFQPIFNGKDLDGWVAEGQKESTKDGVARPVWTAEERKIVCRGQGFGFLRYNRREFGDFVFHVDYRMAPGCNSGLGIRTTVFDPAKSKATRPSYHSYEIQLIDDAGKPATKTSTASLYRYVAPAENASRPASEWNGIDIECAGPRIKVVLNGKTVIDVDQTTVAGLETKPLRGYLCLQNHGGTIEFRDLRVRELKAVAD
jgi:hypothetical protein